MTEMTYRTVDVTARVYSGSDDHAKHTVYWALESGNVVFRDDDVYTLEHILSAVGNGEPIDDAYREEAARMLEHVIWAGNDVMIEKLEITGGV
mgnify:CR=1 FL=1